MSLPVVDQPGCIWQVHPLYTWSGDYNVVSRFDFVGGIGLSAWGVQSGEWLLAPGRFMVSEAAFGPAEDAMHSYIDHKEWSSHPQHRQ